jgi:hypothetical protein
MLFSIYEGTARTLGPHVLLRSGEMDVTSGRTAVVASTGLSLEKPNLRVCCFEWTFGYTGMNS